MSITIATFSKLKLQNVCKVLKAMTLLHYVV